MLYQNVELTNVNELLIGDITTVLDEETRAWLRAHSVGVARASCPIFVE